MDILVINFQPEDADGTYEAHEIVYPMRFQRYNWDTDASSVEDAPPLIVEVNTRPELESLLKEWSLSEEWEYRILPVGQQQPIDLCV